MSLRWVTKSIVSSVLGVAAFALAGSAYAQQFVTQLHAPEPTTWRWGGTSLAIDSNTFVTGAPESIRNADTSDCPKALVGYGAIAIYKKTGNNWSYAQKFWHDPTTTTNEIKFGNSLSLRGNVLVVSAERQDAGSIAGAGAFVVFTRPNATANFTKLGTYYSPHPSSGARLGETSGLASNTQFIAVGEPLTDTALIYRIQNNTVTYAYSVPLPVNGRFSSLFITDSNVLLGTISGYPTLVGYRLGQNGYTNVDMASLAVPNTGVTPVMSGDGNTVATVLYDNNTATYLTQVANFANGNVSWSDTRAIAPGFANADGAGPERISLKENQGFFLSFNDWVNEPFIASYKFSYNSGSGHDYNYQGAIAPGAYSGTGTLTPRATTVAFNGVDLLLGDPDMDVGAGGGPCNSYSYGGVDVFRVGAVTAPGPSGSTKLQPWITSGATNSGQMTAVYQGYAVVGQSLFTDQQGFDGQATLYRQVGQTWEQLEKYNDGRAGSGGRSLLSGFGTSAAINWHSLLIGAPQAGDSTTGAVYFAKSINGAFEHGPMTRMLPSPPSLYEGDKFGAALALENDTLIVGAEEGGPADGNQGTAYVYTYNYATQSWTYKQELQPPAGDVQAWMNFGSQVGISGEYAVVSAPWIDTAAGNGLGTLYVYKRVNGTYTFFQRLMAPVATAYDGFGHTLAVANGGNYIAASGYFSGVRLFRLNGNSYVSDGGVPAPVQQYMSVAMSNVGLLVGTPGEGRVRRFTRAGNNNWVLGGTLSGNADHVFGLSVSLYDSAALIGAPQSDVGGFPAGAGFATTFTNVR